MAPDFEFESITQESTMTNILNLASKWYICPEIYERERNLIFKPAWWLLGPTLELSNRGDYICDRISGWPVFAIRSSDGNIRAFLNVCRHRGASLLQNGSGSASSIRCPYHGWLYDDQGKLLNAPNFGRELSDDGQQIRLRELKVEIWNDLVFVRISEDKGETLADWLGEIANVVDQFASPSVLDYQGEFTVTGELNWKTYCDNTVEGYHLNLIHPRLGKALAGGNVELYSTNAGRTVVFDVTHGSGGGGENLRGQKGLWIYHFPGLQLVLGEKVFKAERVESENPKHVRSKNWAWYCSSLNDDERQDSFEWARQIVQEDFGICAQVTKNMRAGAYEPGPLSPKMESHVARFQEIIRECLDFKT